MISNFDSHGKNVSLYFDKHSTRFTPAYDLVNIAMFPQFKPLLAMGIGDEFEPQAIHAYQLADFAETCHIDKKLLSRLLTRLADKVIQQLSAQGQSNIFINHLKEQPYITASDIAYFRALSDNILEKAIYLKTQAITIPVIRV